MFANLRVSLVLLPLLAAGCAAVDTKTVLTNSDQYLADNFTSAQLVAPLRSQLDKGEAIPKRFQRIQYRYVVDIDEEGRQSQANAVAAYINLGNGYVQSRSELSRNGLPYRVNLALTWAGLYKLRTQTTFVERPTAQNPLDIKEVARFDRALAMPQPGQTYTIDTKTGWSVQLMNFSDEKHVCSAGEPVPASTLHASLSGSAVPVDCTMTGANGVALNKSRHLWVADLGVAFQTEVTSSRSSSKYKIESIEIQR